MGHESDNTNGAAPDTRRPLILVVDDEECVRTVTCACLARAGYRVLSASNGGDALVLLAFSGHKLDLLIADIDMPGMSGVELARHFTGSDPAVPVLLMSGGGQRTPEESGIFALPKPFGFSELCRRVAEIMRANWQAKPTG